VQESDPVSSFFRELFAFGIYKRNQGRICRQITFAAIAITFALGFYSLSKTWIDYPLEVRYGVPGILFLLGLWVSFRVVNVPAFADFMIAVEAEMNKVTWPTRTELFRGSAVVLITIVFLSAALFSFDFFWQFFFKKVLHIL
jgi:preprotein translocase subunit SecE